MIAIEAALAPPPAYLLQAVLPDESLAAYLRSPLARELNPPLTDAEVDELRGWRFFGRSERPTPTAWHLFVQARRAVLRTGN